VGYTSTIGRPGDGPGHERGRGIRVMVVDDSLIVRSAFSRLIEQEQALTLAAAVSTGEDALQLLATERVDVILLDLEMPGIGGLGALPKMIERASEAKILVVSSFTADGAEATVEALALGAADTLQKPASGGFDQAYREKLVAKIRALGRKPLRRSATAATTPETPPPALRPASRHRAGVVAIGRTSIAADVCACASSIHGWATRAAARRRSSGTWASGTCIRSWSASAMTSAPRAKR
jgi:two-component system chemotaxis response regulator CheB